MASASQIDATCRSNSVFRTSTPGRFCERPLHLLYLTYAYLPTLGGTQRSVYNLADKFVCRGHRVTIATNGDELNYSGDLPIPVLTLPIPTPIPHSTADIVKLSTQDPINIRALAALCEKNQIDLVHCHLVNVDTRYAIALKRLLGIKMILTLRGGEFHHWIEGRPRRRAYVAEMLERADYITALSQSQVNDAQILVPDRAWSDCSEVICNPVDADAIAKWADSGEHFYQNGRSYVVFCGRLENEKRVDTLIEAYHGIIAQCPDFPHELIVVGDGSLLPTLTAQAGNGPGAERIRFLGACRYEDTLALIRGAAILVLPSLYEGCPNAVLEAMALGTPVIVSDAAGLRELVTQGVNGDIFPAGDASALAPCLQSLSRDPGRLCLYTAAGKRRIADNHQFDQIAMAYERVYGMLTGHRVPHHRMKQSG